MAHLLVIDPLSMKCRTASGRSIWTSSEWFERGFAGVGNLSWEVVAAEGRDLLALALAADGVILGGSARTAWKDDAFNDQILDLIAWCKHHKIPFLGICYGGQMLARALGGRVSRNPEGIELGTNRIELSEAGKRHFLFKGLRAASFEAVETHRDAVMYLPRRCRLLASTESTRVQAFAFSELMFGVQFHPEMNGEDLRNLWSGWLQTGELESVPEAYQKQIDASACPEVPLVLRNFAERVRAMKRSREEWASGVERLQATFGFGGRFGTLVADR